MPIKYIQKLLLILLVLVVVKGQAQDRCGVMQHWQEQLSRNPSLEQTRNLIEQHTANYQPSTGKSATIITIPVVVHVVYNTAIENVSTQ